MNFKVKVKVKKVKVSNLIIFILDKDETCLKFLTTFQQNCRFDLEGQGQGDLEGQGQGLGGQGPKFNHFYSRQRRNLSEIFNDFSAKLLS